MKGKELKKICNCFIFFIVISMTINGYSQSNLLSDSIKILKKYDKYHLHRVALPIGGIGTGTVSLSGIGEFKDWEIMNVPGKGYSTVENAAKTSPFFAIYTKSKDKQMTKALHGPIDYADYQHHEGRSTNNHGLPRFRNAGFSASYPFGIVNLSDENMPVEVKIIGYNPLIPGREDESGIPIAIIKYEVKNISKEDIKVSISGNIRNFIGKDGTKYTKDWKGDYITVGAKENKNKYISNSKIKGIYMYSDGVNKDDAAWGTMALTTPINNEDKISYRTSSSSDAWENAILDFWDDFSADGNLTEKKKQTTPDPMASLAVKKEIKAGDTKTFTFFLTWHFPNRFAWSKTNVGNYYTTLYKDALDVINKEFDKIPNLTKKTMLFSNSFISSSYPEVLKEAALFNLSTLRSQTVFRIKDGKMFGWEGVFKSVGSCFGSCTHVWNYEQATAFIFNNLSKTLREVEFGYSTKDNGHMSFRTSLPLETSTFSLAAADGQMGTIMKFYRDWQLSGDSNFLKKYWEKVKSAMAFAWTKNSWDGDVDGVMEGVQHNTMDVEYYGPNPQMQIWYLGALKASEKMARFMGDEAFADKCKKLFLQGSKWTDENLFNGDYYIQKIIAPKSQDDIAQGIGKFTGKEDYQLSQGCLVDQLVGQYMAHVLGLGYLVSKENVKKTLQSIFKYNKRESMFEHFNNMRSYAMGDEKALLMASWPRGGRPKVPFPYWSEVMTGFEYTAAVGMLYEGMKGEGLEVIKNIRNRYDGRKRNPYNEAECGYHYARAMTSWAGILAESGFLYSGVDNSIKFTDKQGKYFWSNGNSWGMCIIEEKKGKYNISFKVLHGKLKLKKFILGDKKSKIFNNTKYISEGNKINLII